MIRRKKNEKNPWILCGCNCGKKKHRFDSQGRERRFLPGHYKRTNEIIKKSSELKSRVCSDETILAITAYRNYEKTKLTRKEIYDEVAKDLGLTKKQRSNLSHRVRGYLIETPSEKNRKRQEVWNKGKKGLVKHSQETIDQIIESRSWYKGSKKAIETGKKISKIKKGIPMPEYQKKEINEKNRKKNEIELKKHRRLLKKIITDEIINGVLLSDGTLQRVEKNQNSTFAVSQTGKHRKFL